MDAVRLYTDGACWPTNPGPGGWAAILVTDGAEREIVGGEPQTTNNRMELRSAIEGLRALPKPCRVTVFSDSTYVVHAFQRGWIQAWQANGWRTKGKPKGPVKNRDLWEEILAVASRHAVEWRLIAGHSGNRLNERADQLAQAAAKNAVSDALFALTPE